MSNPADNSEGCEVCGLDRQVLGCRPGKCKNEKAPPLGYTKCPTPGCPRWMGPNRLKCWSEITGGNSGVIYPDWEPPAAPATAHPLPWRWGKEESGGVDRLIDAGGGMPIRLQTYDGEPEVEFASPYVRAVTERAGALDEALREAMAWLEDPSAYAQRDARAFDARVAALLNEIDAAKAGG